MACLTREKGRYYRLRWKFTITLFLLFRPTRGSS